MSHRAYRSLQIKPVNPSIYSSPSSQANPQMLPTQMKIPKNNSNHQQNAIMNHPSKIILSRPSTSRELGKQQNNIEFGKSTGNFITTFPIQLGGNSKIGNKSKGSSKDKNKSSYLMYKRKKQSYNQWLSGDEAQQISNRFYCTLPTKHAKPKSKQSTPQKPSNKIILNSNQLTTGLLLTSRSHIYNNSIYESWSRKQSEKSQRMTRKYSLGAEGKGGLQSYRGYGTGQRNRINEQKGAKFKKLQFQEFKEICRPWSPLDNKEVQIFEDKQVEGICS